MGIISYAQNLEDVLLWRVLGDVPEGHYVDIGAQHPIIDSVSKAFYERGWRGVSVEPLGEYAALLRGDRPDDIVIQAAVTSVSGVVPFYAIPETGLSTLSDHVAKIHGERGFECRERLVPAITLDELFASVPFSEVHWLKVDVEGWETEVISGWATSVMRPWVLVVESTFPMSQVSTHQSWEGAVLSKDYRLVWNDGLNRYYLSEAHLELLERFNYGPNIFDDFQLAASHWFFRDARAGFESNLRLKEAALDEAKRELGVSNQQWEQQTSALRSRVRTLEALEAQIRNGLDEEKIRSLKQQIEWEREAARLAELARDELSARATQFSRDMERITQVNENLRARWEREREMLTLALQKEEAAAKESRESIAHAEAYFREQLFRKDQVIGSAADAQERIARDHGIAMERKEREVAELSRQREALRVHVSLLKEAQEKSEKRIASLESMLSLIREQFAREKHDLEREHFQSFQIIQQEKVEACHSYAVVSARSEWQAQALLATEREIDEMRAALSGLREVFGQEVQARRSEVQLLKDQVMQISDHEVRLRQELSRERQMLQILGVALRETVIRSQMNGESAIDNSSDHRLNALQQLTDAPEVEWGAVGALVGVLIEEVRRVNCELKAKEASYRESLGTIGLIRQTINLAQKALHAYRDSSWVRIGVALRLLPKMNLEAIDSPGTYGENVPDQTQQPLMVRRRLDNKTTSGDLESMKRSIAGPVEVDSQERQDQGSLSALIAGSEGIQGNYIMKDARTISDILGLPDMEFLDAAYQGVLGRRPDPVGLNHYLVQLRRGVAKSEVLFQICSSTEAKAANPSLTGLSSFVRSVRYSKIPVIGSMFSKPVSHNDFSDLRRSISSIERMVMSMRSDIAAQTEINRRESQAVASHLVAIVGQMETLLQQREARSESPAAVGPRHNAAAELAHDNDTIYPATHVLEIQRQLLSEIHGIRGAKL